MKRLALSVCAALSGLAMAASADVKAIDGFGQVLGSVVESLNGSRSTTHWGVSAVLDGGSPTRRHSLAMGIEEMRASSTIKAVIPEPNTYALMAAGLCLIGAAVRRRCLED